MGSSYICPWLWYAHRILDDHCLRVEDANIKSYYNDVGSSGIGIGIGSGSDIYYEEQKDSSINDASLNFKHLLLH